MKERKSNFELMRIISMFLIVLWHVIVHSGILSCCSGNKRLIIDFISSICLVHVNSLILLSGYFQYSKEKINLSKITKLIGQTWFYKVLFLIIAILIGLTVTQVDIFEELLPIDLNNYWFINVYILLYILSPYLNRLIKNINYNEFKRLLFILFILLSIIPAVTSQKALFNDGFSIINFIFLYLIGAFLKKYPLKEGYHFKNLTNNKYKFLLILSFIVLIILNLIIFYFGKTLNQYDSEILKYFGNIIEGNYLKYSSPFAILITIIYFLVFESLNIKNRIINKISLNMFGVYLVHDNHFIRSFIYKELKIADNFTSFSGIKSFVYLFIIALTIFIISLLIEYIRKIIKYLIMKIKLIRNIFKRIDNNLLKIEI